MPYPPSDPYRLTLIHGDGHDSGRHALDEDALLTPIFHALARGSSRRGRRLSVVDPVERFRRDPLTTPMPVVVPARRRPGAHARVEPVPEATRGRHRLRRLPH